MPACPVCRALELARRSAVASMQTAAASNNAAVFATARFRVRRRPAAQPSNSNAAMTDTEPQQSHAWAYSRESLPIRKQRRFPIKPRHLRLMVRARVPQQGPSVVVRAASAPAAVVAGVVRGETPSVHPPGVCATHAALLRCATTPSSPARVNRDEMRARYAHFVNELRRTGRHDAADRLQQRLAMMNHCVDEVMRVNGGVQEEEGMHQIEHLLNSMDLADRAPETTPGAEDKSRPN